MPQDFRDLAMRHTFKKGEHHLPVPDRKPPVAASKRSRNCSDEACVSGVGRESANFDGLDVEFAMRMFSAPHVSERAILRDAEYERAL